MLDILHVADFQNLLALYLPLNGMLPQSFFAKTLLHILQLVSTSTKTEISKTTQIEMYIPKLLSVISK